MPRIVTGLARIGAVVTRMGQKFHCGATFGGDQRGPGRTTISSSLTGSVARATGGYRVAPAVQASSRPVTATGCVVLSRIGLTCSTLTQAAIAAGSAIRLIGTEWWWRWRGRFRSDRHRRLLLFLFLLLLPLACFRIGKVVQWSQYAEGQTGQQAHDATARATEGEGAGQGIEAFGVHSWHSLVVRRKI